jgi:lysophospholipase L1-like esterase
MMTEKGARAMSSLFQADYGIPDRLTVLFLGDSITDNGTYIAYMDAYFRQHLPEKELQFINLGVSSETASGLSEPGHPFPRPCVHDRIGNALRETKPDWVLIGYGMNDGIYHPFSEDRFAAYRKGVLDAIGRVKHAGAKAIVMTPPPFDADSFSPNGALRSAGATTYDYANPYAGYDEVLQHYSRWILSLGDIADGAVDIHAPLTLYTEQRKKADPAYRSGDGIHPNPSGHRTIAQLLLRNLFDLASERMPEYAEQPQPSSYFTLVWERHRLLSAAWKEHVGHTNPNKAAALPLAEALSQAREIELRIRKRLSEQ